MILCMLIASVLFLLFAWLFLSAGDNVAGTLIACSREIQMEEIRKNQIAMTLLAEEMKRTGMLSDKKKLRQGKTYRKKSEEAQKRLEKLKKGQISALDLIPLAGYRLVQLLGWDSTNDVVKRLYRQCVQFKEKKEAMNYTYYLLGSLIGYLLLGFLAFFAALGLGLAINLGTRSLVVAGGFLVVFLLLGYLPYDSVNSTITKRREEIERQFPQAVSKMTLLTVAGMEVNQAWNLTCASGTGTLYEEMNRVRMELENNESPSEAYSRFITRCSNPYATKLATAIIQNISKGNSEIVSLFRTLNDESWMEHKHNARRMGEKIQSKLLIPTLLMFGGILILVIVPVLSGFSF